ncbi:hypothetical protein EJ03DRAFT_143144 [Teratosphaeria nubilosa]|uniref:Uncharacterized protein n=1 Tax=Teratosphaeria nubilosa TaxID=161662 RepID=A0A6G1L6A3_9PEZI|nr:hypothetical protein EJ03DRAFT_143144 [Teratosphaeria nubilosa]
MPTTMDASHTSDSGGHTPMPSTPTPGAIFIPVTPPSGSREYTDARERIDSPQVTAPEDPVNEDETDIEMTSTPDAASTPSAMPSTPTLASASSMPARSPQGAIAARHQPRSGTYIKNGYYAGFYVQPRGLSAMQCWELESKGRCYWQREWVVAPDGKGEGEWQERAVKFGQLDADQKVSWYFSMYHHQMIRVTGGELRAAGGELRSEAPNVAGGSSLVQSTGAQEQRDVDQVMVDGNGDVQNGNGDVHDGSSGLRLDGSEAGEAYRQQIEMSADQAVAYGNMPLHIAPQGLDAGYARATQEMAKDDQVLAYRLHTPSIELHQRLRDGVDRRPLSQKLHESLIGSRRKVAKDRLYRRSSKAPDQVAEIVTFKPNGGHDYGGLNTHIGARWRGAELPPIYREGWDEFMTTAARAKRWEKPVGELIMGKIAVDLKFPSPYKQEEF